MAVMTGTLLTLTCAGKTRAAEETPLLAHSATLSKTQVVFAYGGYLWSVAREGGDARQLTTGGHEGAPVFSPDGKSIAFTGQDRKSTRLNSSHVKISYAVFCL